MGCECNLCATTNLFTTIGFNFDCNYCNYCNIGLDKSRNCNDLASTCSISNASSTYCRNNRMDFYNNKSFFSYRTNSKH